MFGLVDLDAITLTEDHSFTELAGRTMFGVYSYITVIVLLNMLIAMMNNSYQIISVRQFQKYFCKSLKGNIGYTGTETFAKET